MIEKQAPVIAQDTYVVCTKAGIIEYLEFGIPSTVAFSSIQFIFLILPFGAAYYGVEYQAAHIVLETIISIEEYAAFGLC